MPPRTEREITRDWAISTYGDLITALMATIARAEKAELSLRKERERSLRVLHALKGN